jgi:hypothetical protein
MILIEGPITPHVTIMIVRRKKIDQINKGETNILVCKNSPPMRRIKNHGH